MNVKHRKKILKNLIGKKILKVNCISANCIDLYIEGQVPIRLEAECISATIGLYGINATQMIEGKVK